MGPGKSTSRFAGGSLQLRIQHPDYSIQQLADSLSTPLAKSGVNHRLRKINKMADEL